MRILYKQRLWIYIVLLVLVLICARLLMKPGEPAQRDLPEIAREGILRIALDYNPLSYYVSGDTLVGFEYELSQLISKESGLSVELHPEVSLIKSLEGLNNNRYDIVARSLPVTTDNKKDYLFTEPLIHSKQVLVQRKEEYNNGKRPLRNQLELAKKTLHIISDTPTLLRINNLAHEIGDTIYVEEESTYGAEQMIIMVAKGDIEFAVCDEVIARNMSADFPEIDYATDISFTQFQSWAMRKDAKILQDSLNVWIERIQQSEKFEKLYRKYHLPATSRP